MCAALYVLAKGITLSHTMCALTAKWLLDSSLIARLARGPFTNLFGLVWLTGLKLLMAAVWPLKWVQGLFCRYACIDVPVVLLLCGLGQSYSHPLLYECTRNPQPYIENTFKQHQTWVCMGAGRTQGSGQCRPSRALQGLENGQQCMIIAQQ